MKRLTNNQRIPGSFRDPTGFLFIDQGILYRQINPSGFDDYFLLQNSGLYQELIEAELLIPHEEISAYDQNSPPDQIVIKPEEVSFISYPYEWSFSQLKNAAQITLQIQKIALQKGMSLKDCSAYNIQFQHGKPKLIDTLSFERYQEGEPWVAYRQFCQHFLAPLALMAYTDVRLSQLFRVYIDGIPLDLASKLLPKKTSLNFSINVHIHIHAKSQSRYSEIKIDPDKDRRQMKEHQLLGLVDSLASGIEKLTWKPEQTDWAEYEKFHNYSSAALLHKSDLVAQFISQTQPSLVWDLGANIGYFSFLFSQYVSGTGWVFAFEALPENIARIEENLSLNPEIINIKIIPKAVIDKCEQIGFLIGPSGGTGKTIGSAGRQNITYQNEISIDGISLDHFVFNEIVAQYGCLLEKGVSVCQGHG